MENMLEKKYRIMIVDDDPFMRNLLSNELEINGYHVIAMDSALKAMNAMASDKVDVIVTDIFMPDMDGIELIRSLRMNYSGITVFAMSSGTKTPGSSSTDDYLRFARRLGADEVFTKPVDMEALLSRLKQYAGPV